MNLRFTHRLYLSFMCSLATINTERLKNCGLRGRDVDPVTAGGLGGRQGASESWIQYNARDLIYLSLDLNQWRGNDHQGHKLHEYQSGELEKTSTG